MVCCQPLKVLPPEMRRAFGTLGGRISIQRSPTRWVEDSFLERAAGGLFFARKNKPPQATHQQGLTRQEASAKHGAIRYRAAVFLAAFP